MTSLSWYICLAAIGPIIAAYSIYKKRYIYKVSTLIVFYLFTAAITWFGEFTVLGLFDSYAYKPGLFSDPWAENLFAHLLLNTTMFPSAAILMQAYSLGYWGMSLITALFVFAEYLFVRLGIYEQHWWNYCFSAINVVAFLTISGKWFAHVRNATRRIPRFLTFYFVGFIIIHTPAPILLLMSKQYYKLDVVNDFVGNTCRSSIIIIFSYHMVEVLLLVTFVSILGKWYWKLVPFIIAIAGHSMLARLNIMVLLNGWKLIYTLTLYVICLTIFIFIEKYTLRPDQKRSNKGTV